MINIIKFTEAVHKLYPTVTTIRGDVAYDKDDNVVEYDRAKVEAEAAKEIK
jgi:hypothetical protein